MPSLSNEKRTLLSALGYLSISTTLIVLKSRAFGLCTYRRLHCPRLSRNLPLRVIRASTVQFSVFHGFLSMCLFRIKPSSSIKSNVLMPIPGNLRCHLPLLKSASNLFLAGVSSTHVGRNISYPSSRFLLINNHLYSYQTQPINVNPLIGSNVPLVG